MIPMVGLGGSAGSIQAMTEFFQDMPADSGLSFVVVLHLSPTHQSTLPELLGRSTKMPVVAATDGLKVAINHVYVIPPGKYLAAVDGHLKLTDFERERGKRVAVDLFFRSLADTHGPNAAAVVLSGADGDGALGIKRIKERGGLTIVQDPQEAEYAEMPRASIDTGMIDWVLDIKDMPNRLLRYFHSRDRLRLPPEDGPQPLPTEAPSVDEGESALRDVLVFLRMRTGRDFSYYKRATILRRIARRMQVNGVDDLPAYLNFLRTHSGEAGALLQDLLITVTNFFRDRDVFDALEKQIPQLFQNKSQADSVRSLGAGLCHRRRSVLDRHAPFGACSKSRIPAGPSSLCLRFGRSGHPNCPGGKLPGSDHGRCERRTVAAILCQGSSRLPRPA